MEMKLQKNGTSLAVSLLGELDQHSAGRVRENLEMAVRKESVSHLTLDLRSLSFMDSAGIGVFISIFHIVEALGGEMELICREGIIYKMVTLAGLSKLMDVRVGGEYE